MNKLLLLVLSAFVLLFGGRAAHAATPSRTVTVQVVRTDGKVHGDKMVTIYFVDPQGRQRSTYTFTDDRGVARLRLPDQLGSDTVYVTAGYISDLWCERQTVSAGETRLSIVYRGINPDWQHHSCREDHDY